MACATRLELLQQARQELDAALQAVRWATPEGLALARRLLYPLLAAELERYYRRRGITDPHALVELHDDAYLTILGRLTQAREQNEPPREYLSALYWTAKRLFFAHQRKARLVFQTNGFPSVRTSPIDPDNRGKLPSPTLITPGFALAGLVPPVSPEDPLGTQYAKVEGLPLELSDRQFATLKGLAAGMAHKEIADQAGLPVRSIHDAVGGVEKKLQEALQDPSVRRSQMGFVADPGAENRVLILLERQGKERVFLGEARYALPSNTAALVLNGPPRGEDEDTRRLRLKLLFEVRHDIEELLGSRRFPFHAAFDVDVSESIWNYALLRAYGFNLDEMAEAFKIDKRSVSAKLEHLANTVAIQTFVPREETDFRTAYFFSAPDPQNGLVVVVGDLQKGYTRLQLRLRDGRSEGRHKQQDKFRFARSKVEQAIAQVTENCRPILTDYILKGQSTRAIAARLQVREDTVRKKMADGSFQLSRILEEPELNLFNLVVSE